MDIPDERKIHKNPIPRLGGVAIWLCTVVSFMILVVVCSKYPNGNLLSGLFTGGSLMFLLGMVDDIYNLSPKFKLFVQLGAALVAILLGVKIDILSNPFGAPILLGWVSIPLTMIWLVGITNAMNFIDGVDGLAGTVTTISAVTLGVIAISTDQPISALVAALLAGAMLGFLVFNFHPAKIFMGDSGALFAGFMLAGLSVTGVLKTLAVTIILPMFILAVPIMDISFSTFRRLLKGKNPLKADAEHIHHKLIKAGFSQDKTVIIFILLATSAGAVASILVNAYYLYIKAVLIVFCIMLLASYLSKTNKIESFYDKIWTKFSNRTTKED